MEKTYERTWSAGKLPVPERHDPEWGRTDVEWNGEGYLLPRGGLISMHVAAIAQMIAYLKHETVLEVGAGMGTILALLSARFPNIAFTGAELTESGVNRARSNPQFKSLPKELADMCPWKKINRTAFRNIDFRQGDATALEFADNSFDMVITKQAREQMENVRDKASSEISRVARSHVVMVEPFADFNNGPLRQLAIRAKNYFTLPVARLPDYGMMPVAVFDDWGKSLTLGAGLVVCEV